MKFIDFDTKITLSQSDIALWKTILPQVKDYSENDFQKYLSELTEIDNLRRETPNILPTLPESIGLCKNLRKLRIFGCDMTALPKSISQLNQLQELELNWCKKLTALPECIGQLNHLQTLKLEICNITTLPESISKLSNLQILRINCYSLRILPDTIGQLSQLKELNLSNSYRLIALPRSIQQLRNLRELHLYHCINIPRLPKNFLPACDIYQDSAFDRAKYKIFGIPEFLGDD